MQPWQNPLEEADSDYDEVFVEALTPSIEVQRPSSIEEAPPTPLQNPGEEADLDEKEDFEEAWTPSTESPRPSPLRKLRPHRYRTYPKK